MIVDARQIEKLTGRRLEKKASDADRVVSAIANLADALTKQAERPAPVIEVNVPPQKTPPPVIEVTVPPSSVTVQDIPPEPRRPWKFEVNDNKGNLKYTITATPN